MMENLYPPGWDDLHVRRVLELYDEQSDEEVAAEDEAAFQAPDRGPSAGRARG